MTWIQMSRESENTSGPLQRGVCLTVETRGISSLQNTRVMKTGSPSLQRKAGNEGKKQCQRDKEIPGYNSPTCSAQLSFFWSCPKGGTSLVVLGVRSEAGGIPTHCRRAGREEQLGNVWQSKR